MKRGSPEKKSPRLRKGVGVTEGGDYLLFRFRSTIGVIRFNFSVRNGKRWNPYAVITLIRLDRADWKQRPLSRRPALLHFSKTLAQRAFGFFSSFGMSRAISTARLNVSPRLHLRPIDVVVCDGPWRDLILKLASCLDAFSTYPAQTRLPGCAPGGTTGAPEVCPTRSSRTSVGSSQISCAHNR